MSEPTFTPGSYFPEDFFTFFGVLHRKDETGNRCLTAYNLKQSMGKLTFGEFSRRCDMCFGPEFQYPDGQFK